MNLTRRQLDLFVTTALVGNLTRAAQALHLSQPALSRALAQFESRLGVRLFERTTRRLSLSHEGERFLPVARRLLREMADAVAIVRDDGDGLRGPLTIAVGTAFGTTVLPPVLHALNEAHPGIRIKVVDDNSEGITRRVVQGDADLGIGSPIGDTGGLDCRPLLEAAIGVLGDPARVRLGATTGAAAIGALTLLKESADTSIMHLLRSRGSDIVARMEAGIEVSSLALQLALAREGIGVAVLSALGASHPAAAGLRFSPLRPALRRTLFLMRRRDAAATPQARLLVERLLALRPPAGLRAGVRWLASAAAAAPAG